MEALFLRHDIAKIKNKIPDRQYILAHRKNGETKHNKYTTNGRRCKKRMNF